MVRVGTRGAVMSSRWDDESRVVRGDWLPASTRGLAGDTAVGTTADTAAVPLRERLCPTLGQVTWRVSGCGPSTWLDSGLGGTTAGELMVDVISAEFLSLPRKTSASEELQYSPLKRKQGQGVRSWRKATPIYIPPQKKVESPSVLSPPPSEFLRICGCFLLKGKLAKKVLNPL